MKILIMCFLSIDWIRTKAGNMFSVRTQIGPYTYFQVVSVHQTMFSRSSRQMKSFTLCHLLMMI